MPKMKFTDGFWNENGDFIEFNEEIMVPSYICSNGHMALCDLNDTTLLLSFSTASALAAVLLSVTANVVLTND
jgi:hypothetical protein